LALGAIIKDNMGYSFIFRFSENDIDFSPRAGSFFNYDKFLLNEFFNTTNQEFISVMAAYKKRYGQSAYDYVMKNYCYDWRRGDRTLSNVQESRILSVMPDFLNDAAKQKLEKIKEEARYKLGIEEVSNVIKKSVQSFFPVQGTLYSRQIIATAEDILSIFQKEFERAKAIQVTQQNSKFRYDRIVVLNEDELNEALNIAKYIVYVKLQKQFNQIVKDFNTFLPFMQGFRRGIFKAVYTISIFNIKTEIANAKFAKVSMPSYRIKETETNSRFKETADKYLAYEMANIHSETNKAITNAFLNANDIKLFLNHYEELSNSDSEINMKSTFTGEGGILNMEAKMKPIKMLKTSIAKSAVKILIYTIVVAGLGTWVSAYKLWMLLFYGGIFAGGLYISLISEEVKQIKLYKSEIRLYGQ
jgi:hypothetical protein